MNGLFKDDSPFYKVLNDLEIRIEKASTSKQLESLYDHTMREMNMLVSQNSMPNQNSDLTNSNNVQSMDLPEMKMLQTLTDNFLEHFSDWDEEGLTK